jgi:hypothetical protein
MLGRYVGGALTVRSPTFREANLVAASALRKGAMRKPVGGGAEEPRWSNEPPAVEPTAEPTDVDDSRFRLAVDDLIAGSADEVVLFNDSAVREVVLESAEPPVDKGDVDTHVTADGVDVSGFTFLRFSDGLTLFHDPDTRVRVDTTRRERRS